VQAAHNSPLLGHGSPRKQKQAGFISRLCGGSKESEDAHVPGKKWVQVFDHTGAKSAPLPFGFSAVTRLLSFMLPLNSPGSCQCCVECLLALADCLLAAPV